jgi:hypothetical protein
MSIPDTFRLSNLKDSIKKFFNAELKTARGIHTVFDNMLKQPANMDRWVGIRVGDRGHKRFTFVPVEVFTCTRRDPEGFRNAQLVDTIVSLTLDDTKDDWMRRIPLYKSHPTDPWTEIGTLLFQEVIESGDMETEDNTKVRVLTIKMSFASGM